MPAQNKLFAYPEYKNFLRTLKANHRVCSLGDWDGSKAVILRHDIDLDIASAFRLAVIEHELGVPSTYFVMMTAHTYNSWSVENQDLIRRIASFGFEIGLHFDPGAYPECDDAKLKKKVDHEAAMLEMIIDKKIKSVSIHNPSVHGKFLQFPGYRNAYEKEIFSPDRYLSDSRMIVQHDIYEFIKRVKDHPIQLLLHPMYYTETGESFQEIFYHFVKDYLEIGDRVFSVNSTYAASFQKGLMDYVIGRGC